jgi:hypothetical protein
MKPYSIQSTHGGKLASKVMLSRCIVGRSGGRTPWPPKILNKRTNLVKPRVPRGSPGLGHVAPFYSSNDATCQPMTRPAVIQSKLTTSANCQVTCHVCHVIMYGCLRQHCTTLPRGSTACPVSIIFFFACLARRTDLDNFSIRTPFVKVNIPPESGERDGRNGCTEHFLSIF